MPVTRFHLLAVGDHFAFEGRVWVKRSPLLAIDTENGGQRFIPRSAVVSPTGGAEPAPAPPPAPPVPRERVDAAFGHFYAECRRALAAVAAGEVQASAAQLALEHARGRFLAELDGRP